MIMVTLVPAVQVMRIISKPLTATLVVLVAVVVDIDLRSGIMAITMVAVIIPGVGFCF